MEPSHADIDIIDNAEGDKKYLKRIKELFEQTKESRNGSNKRTASRDAR